MDRYIGLDVHAASRTMAVVGPTGRRIRLQVLDTNAGPLVEALRGIGGDRHVCLEEGTQSSWLYEVLEPHAAEAVVVCGFAQRGPKSDDKVAFWLAGRFAPSLGVWPRPTCGAPLASTASFSSSASPSHRPPSRSTCRVGESRGLRLDVRF
jgi:hypothetical protein